MTTDIRSFLTKMDTAVANGDDRGDAVAPAKPVKPKKQTIEKTYQKKTQLEHILLRPDTYIGSVEPTKETMWIYDRENECMVHKEIDFVPGLYKIFDEILVNAADNKQQDKKMDCIKVDIDAETNTVSVWNNGQGIPVTMHGEEGMYVPTMIFGHLLTSSNYNDDEQKVTGGRNGFGAKLCNIFSTSFTVETASKEYKRKFRQTWRDNMSKSSEPLIKESTGDDYTKVTFSPDLAKFKMEKLDDDIVGLMSRRAFDVAASTGGVKVFLNGRRLPVKNFKEYVDMYVKRCEDHAGNPLKVVYERPHERWEVACALSVGGTFQQISFVNSIATSKGGKHVDHVADAIAKHLLESVKKKNKGGVNVPPSRVKNHMWLFVNCLIVNPTFDSQTKENMTSQVKNFGSKCTLSEKFFASVTKCGIIESVLSWARGKENAVLSKASGTKKSRLTGIPKLEDANKAGEKESLKCTLILTEGDSAKALAVAGLGVVGRDYYGVFPLRGKLLNVREASLKQIEENAEIRSLIKILGLKHQKKYTTENDMKTLRYGKVMIMTDQDQDGSHIKGLLINFVHHFWPELIHRNFLEVFITPIVKARKKKEVLSFYSIPEYDEWKANTPNHKSFSIKYYKGLGTSDSKEAREYFANIDRHRIRFRYASQQDDDHVLLAFSKKHVDHRKEWLTNFMEESRRRKEIGLPEKYLYTKGTKFISYTDFINLELVLFSNADNIRSIPSMVDGLKPTQRKIIYTCLKRNFQKEVKLTELCGAVNGTAAYHHGEASLCSTIINLAQNFVGSNNLNLLEPRGQFGTRLTGGKDAASPRYIFTKVSPLTRKIFHPDDDALLKHEYDDNKKAEPFWYMPIVPLVLVNGADGIGTGWMTKIPNYNPRELVGNIRKMLDGGGAADDLEHMLPWYKNFVGTIESCGDQRYVVSGEITVTGDDKLEITELPVGTWTQTYRENVLDLFRDGSEKVRPIITDYEQQHTDSTVKFVITCPPNKLAELELDGLHKVFKLQTMISTAQMCAFDEFGCLRKYDTVDDILKEFFELRLKMYKKRKDYQIGLLEAQADKLSNQARFIVEKCSGELVIENKKRKTIVDELFKRGYLPDPVLAWQHNVRTDDNEEEHEDEEAENVTETAGRPTETKQFDYLVGMSMWKLSHEDKEELLKQRDAKLEQLNDLRKKSPPDLWRDDLDAFAEELDKVEEREKNEEEIESKGPTAKKASKKKPAFVQAKEPCPATGRRIVPTVGEDIKKRVQNAAKARENKGKKGVKKEIVDKEEKDEFDLMVENKKSLKAKLGISNDVVQKKTKSSRKSESSFSNPDDSTGSLTKRKRKKQTFNSSFDVSFTENNFSDSPTSDSDFEIKSKPKAQKKQRISSDEEPKETLSRNKPGRQKKETKYVFESEESDF